MLFERLKKRKRVLELYNKIESENKTFDINIISFNDLIEKMEKIYYMSCEIYNVQEKEKIIAGTIDDVKKSIISQIKKFYFIKINDFLINYKELESFIKIRDFGHEINLINSENFSSLIDELKDDVQKIFENHKVVYINYRNDPYKGYKDSKITLILNYVFKNDNFNEKDLINSFSIDETKTKNVFEFLEKQKIISPSDGKGNRKRLISKRNDIFARGLNPMEMELIYKKYGRKIKDIDYENYDCEDKKDLLGMIDNEISGLEFEKIAKQILMENGFYHVITTVATGDFGVDILAEKDEVRYAIQCKKYSSPVGVKAVQEVIGSKIMNNSHVAVVLTNSFFTENAKELAEKNGVLLWDRKKLKELIEKSTIGRNMNLISKESSYKYETDIDDPLYNDVLRYAINEGKISTSLIQRRFKLGYNRAARIIDLLEHRGIVGPSTGTSQPREVYIDNMNEAKDCFL